jgi:hypothetical protein
MMSASATGAAASSGLPVAAHRLELEILGLEHRLGREQDAALDDVAQLADVAGPTPLAQRPFGARS